MYICRNTISTYANMTCMVCSAVLNKDLIYLKYNNSNILNVEITKTRLAPARTDFNYPKYYLQQLTVPHFQRPHKGLYSYNFRNNFFIFEHLLKNSTESQWTGNIFGV